MRERKREREKGIERESERDDEGLETKQGEKEEDRGREGGRGSERERDGESERESVWERERWIGNKITFFHENEIRICIAEKKNKSESITTNERHFHQNILISLNAIIIVHHLFTPLTLSSEIEYAENLNFNRTKQTDEAKPTTKCIYFSYVKRHSLLSSLSYLSWFETCSKKDKHAIGIN